MSESMLELTKVSKRLKSFSFGPISLQLHQGFVAAIVGPNGSGKSTLFRILMNLIEQDAGHIHWFGRMFGENESKIKQNIGYVSSGLYDVFGHLSIVELASLVSYWYPTWKDERFRRMADRYEIDLKKKYGECSTGTKKKVDFILAIVHEPLLLLLDEHTAGVDMSSQRKMKEDIIQFMDRGDRSIMVATHQQEEVQQFCDQVYILKQGQLLHHFDKDEAEQCWVRLWVSSLPQTVTQHPNVKEVNHRSRQLVTDHVPTIEAILHQKGIKVQHRQRLPIDEIIEYYLNGDSN